MQTPENNSKPSCWKSNLLVDCDYTELLKSQSILYTQLTLAGKDAQGGEGSRLQPVLPVALDGGRRREAGKGWYPKKGTRAEDPGPRRQGAGEMLRGDLGTGAGCWNSPVLQGPLPCGTRRQRVVERGLCSPAAGILAGKGAEPLLPLFHKSRLLTRKDQIVAVK